MNSKIREIIYKPNITSKASIIEGWTPFRFDNRISIKVSCFIDIIQAWAICTDLSEMLNFKIRQRYITNEGFT